MNEIINIFKTKKSVPLDQFINIALYHKKFGYYMKHNPFGANSDYITSPLISNLFSEIIAIWCVAFWENLNKPKKFVIVELGPGNASLCNDLLNTFKNFKEFNKCFEIKLLEKSKKLKRIQKTKIKNRKVKWIKKINDLNYGPIIFIGNEFFDSLAIKQLYKKNKSIHEKYVTLKKNENYLKFTYKKANKNLISILKKLKLTTRNGTIEYPKEALKYLIKISKLINTYGGGLLSFDYGYIKNKNVNTLQSIKRHEKVNIFSDPGNTDITSHINYTLFSNILKKKNLNVEKITTQSEFLQKLGIVERANILSKNVSFKAKANMYYRLKRLLYYKEMGNLFKVIFAYKKGKKFNLGF